MASLRGSVRWITIFALLLLCTSVASAFADSSEPSSGSEPTAQELAEAPVANSEEVAEAIEGESGQSIGMTVTDPAAAEEMPHRNLNRAEAAELMSGVFESELQSPAGIFDELRVEKFLAPNVAVILGGETPAQAPKAQQQEAQSSDEGRESEASTPGTDKEELRAGSPAESEDESGSTPPVVSPAPALSEDSRLLDSTVPLRTEASNGEQAPVDLSLEQIGGGLQPVNPLVEVGIPPNLGEGIELPESGIKIELAGAPEERSPSEVDQSVGFYPNVATDTDLAVAPTPTGVETMTQLRSADSPRSETFTLALPQGDELRAKDGGAEVTREGEVLLGIAPPTALDASGGSVPVSLRVSGDSLTLMVSPNESADYPILLDPLFQSYEWYAKKTEEGIHYGQMEGWHEQENHHGGFFEFATDVRGTEFEPAVPYATPGLYLGSLTTLEAGGEGFWLYTVPRYFSDPPQHEGNEPQSFISKLTVTDMDWVAKSEYHSPYVYMGLWGPNTGWASIYSHEGLKGHSVNGMSTLFTFENPNSAGDVKTAEIGMHSTETTSGPSWAYLYVGAATIELTEPASTIPKFAEAYGPSEWVNQTLAPIHFKAEDAGLGVSSITISGEQGSPPPSWKATYNCTGVAEKPCPYTWNSSKNVEPAALPQGVDTLKVVAEDPVGHISTQEKEGKLIDTHVQVKVDHTAPELSLSGTMTEQARLGTKRPSYTLAWSVIDGTTEHPQSGAAKVAVKVDGQLVHEEAPGCSSRNCSLASQWTLESSNYPGGQHTVEVVATDGVGLQTKRIVTIELHPSPPALALSGTMTEQGTLGTTRPRYKLKLNASAEAGIESSPSAPTFVSMFGTSGIGNGQFAHPGDVALDVKGNLWVVDENNNRVEEFSEAGEYLTQFGSKGSANGQLSRPTSIAIDAKGNLWVTDAANRRVEEFNEKGEYLSKFGSEGTGNGQFAGGGPEGIAIDPKGNIWVSDTYGARLEKFNEKGEFIKVVGTRGTETGQLMEPTGIDIAPGGNVWVADWANNRVEVYNEAGEYVRQFGSEGSGNSQFRRPDALAIDTKGDVWVGDQNNERVQEFNQNGEYIAQFGSSGSGNGQFSFGYPMGIAVNSKGNLWVTDTGNNRVQRWQMPNYAPSYSSAFGSTGSGNGQFSHPADVAIDAKGNLWVADENNNRVEKFNEAGEYLRQFGSSGSGNGQFIRPKSIAIDAKGNLWVADSGNSRLEKFNETGEFLKAVGSSGSGNGQFSGPEGIAIDPKGNIWVSDTYNYRVQELNENGEFIKIVSPSGLGSIEPTGIDVGPAGNVWVTDWAGNRVVELSESGSLLRSFGTAGTGNGQFNRPDAVAVDNQGFVWVGDQNNGRIEAFNQSGEYVTQFGAKGSGTGQFSFSYPLGIAADARGNLWVADTNNNRVQRWTHANWQSEIATEITVDGNRVDSGQAGCIGEHCPIIREWTLQSSTYSAGKHTVVAKATDGLGNTSSKTLTIEVQPDTTKPALEVGGELANAPEGWVEQESYGLHASAKDAGYGATSLAFKIDGGTVASETQECVEGACEEAFSKQIDMQPYSGGAHTAEITAIDGAGNSTTKRWTINVDPEGHISTEEAAATLEAVEGTTEETPVAPTDELLEPEQIEGGDNPGLRQTGSEIESTGVPDTTTMTTDPGDGFTIQSPAGTTTITPNVSETASSTAITEGVAGVSANIRNEVDSVIRPEYNGVQTFQAIRSESSPTSYSWTVHLAEGQSLRAVDREYAEVLYEDGTVAFLITAEEAHDATGAKVPTSIEVNGNVVTLNVEFHSGTFVYPIVAGAGWETSYKVPVIVQGPEDEAEIKQREQEERERLAEAERLEREAAEKGITPELTLTEAEALISPEKASSVAAPPEPTGEAQASKVRYFEANVFTCNREFSLPIVGEVIPECGLYKVQIHEGYFLRHTSSAEWSLMLPKCTKYPPQGSWALVFHADLESCGLHEPYRVLKGSGEHLIAYSHFRTELEYLPEIGSVSKTLSLVDKVFPNGYQEGVTHEIASHVVQN